MAFNFSKIMQLYGCDLLLGTIAAFYVFMAPYTKVEESFNIQVNSYSRIGSKNNPQIEWLLASGGIFLGCLILCTLRFFRIQLKAFYYYAFSLPSVLLGVWYSGTYRYSKEEEIPLVELQK